MVILVVTTTGQGLNPIYCWWRLVIFSQLLGFQAISGMFTPILAEYVRLDNVLFFPIKRCWKSKCQLFLHTKGSTWKKRYDCVFVVSTTQTNKNIWHRGIWNYPRVNSVYGCCFFCFCNAGKGPCESVIHIPGGLQVHKFTSAVAWWNRKRIHKSTLY